MTRKLLIFGASGFLGSRLCLSFPGFLIIGTGLTRASGKILALDVRDVDKAARFAASHSPDAIIYSAALADTAACATDETSAELINATAPAAIASSVDCPLIYISTDYVFDGRRSWYSEGCQTNPISKYGLTKLAGERGVLASNPLNAVLRVSGLYDNYCTSTGALGDVSAGRVDLVSAPLYVHDAISAIRTVLRNRLTGVIHAAGPTRMSRYDFLQLSRLQFWDAPDVTPTLSGDSQSRPKCSALQCDILKKSGWKARSPASVFVPATFHPENLHIQKISSPGTRVIAFDFVGALLGQRLEASNTAIDKIANECGRVHDHRSFWKHAIDESGDEFIAEQVADRYVINPDLWRSVIQRRREGFKLVATNNGAYTTDAKWRDRLGLDLWFHGSFNSVELGIEKTSSRFFREVARRIRVAVSELIT